MAPVSLCIFCWLRHIRCYGDGLKVMIDHGAGMSVHLSEDDRCQTLPPRLEAPTVLFSQICIIQGVELSCLTSVCGDSFGIKMT